LIGLYDQTGMLRFAGRDQADCLAYAELFALAEDSFSLESLQAEGLPLAALERSDLL
jgi:hypothetical protein